MKVPVVMIIAASSMSIGATAASAQTTNPGLLGNGNVLPSELVARLRARIGLGWCGAARHGHALSVVHDALSLALRSGAFSCRSGTVIFAGSMPAPRRAKTTSSERLHHQYQDAQE